MSGYALKTDNIIHNYIILKSVGEINHNQYFHNFLYTLILKFQNIRHIFETLLKYRL